MFDRLKCKVGIHGWGPWQYSANDSCVQTRVCQRCQATSNQTQHIWGGWEYTSPDSCMQVRACQRCGAKENQEAEHQWSQWAYTASDSCTQVRTCQRCHATKNRAAEHQWGQWAYAASGTCDQVRLCQRCGAEESQVAEHVWDVWEYKGRPHATSCVFAAAVEPEIGKQRAKWSMTGALGHRSQETRQPRKSARANAVTSRRRAPYAAERPRLVSNARL